VEVRLEVVLDVRRGDEARGLGEGGTEFKSGAILNERMTSTKPRKYRRGKETPRDAESASSQPGLQP
jgi:hypothetical protein